MFHILLHQKVSHLPLVLPMFFPMVSPQAVLPRIPGSLQAGPGALYDATPPEASAGRLRQRDEVIPWRSGKELGLPWPIESSLIYPAIKW